MIRLWECGYCDAVVKEDDMSMLALAYELRSEQEW